MSLPINSEKNLLALVKIELAINQDDEDKHSTAEDIKALINALFLKTLGALQDSHDRGQPPEW